MTCDIWSLDSFPLCLGGNVFGWTCDRNQSFAVLDAYAAAGGNFIDTAETYSAWVPGNVGGESETIIGEWMARRGNRSQMIIATKAENDQPLTAGNVRSKAEASLRRLRTDYIDLYFVHHDDLETPLDEVLGAFDALVKDGIVRHTAESNFSPRRLREALDVSQHHGFARFGAVQAEYNLVERDYETELRNVIEVSGSPCLPYCSLANGFLTGKYRPGETARPSPRANAAARYLDERGLWVLGALGEVASEHAAPMAAVALAWLRAQPTVVAPVASAASREQLRELLFQVELSEEQLERLSSRT